MAKFGCEMLSENEKNIALEISQILYNSVLHAEICTTFGSRAKIVQLKKKYEV